MATAEPANDRSPEDETLTYELYGVKIAPLVRSFHKFDGTRRLSELRTNVLDMLLRDDATLQSAASALNMNPKHVSSIISSFKTTLSIPRKEEPNVTIREIWNREIKIIIYAWRLYRRHGVGIARKLDLLETTAKQGASLAEGRPSTSLASESQRQQAERIAGLMQQGRVNDAVVRVLDVLLEQETVSATASALETSTGRISTVCGQAKRLFAIPRTDKPTEMSLLKEAWRNFRHHFPSDESARDAVVEGRPGSEDTPADHTADVDPIHEDVRPDELSPRLVFEERHEPVPSDSSGAITEMQMLWSHSPSFLEDQRRLVSEGYRIEKPKHFVSFDPVIRTVSVVLLVKRVM